MTGTRLLTKLKEFFYIITFKDSCETWWQYLLMLLCLPVIWMFIFFFGVGLCCLYAILGVLYFIALILIRLCPLFLALAAIAVIIRVL